MPTLYLTTPGAKGTLSGEHLRVEMPLRDGEVPPPRHIPLHEVEQVTVHERASLTIPAMAELLRRQIPITLIDRQERILGIVRAPGRPAPRRYAQWRRSEEPSFRLALASALVEAKISNQRRVLQRLAANRPEVEIGDALDRLGQMAGAALDAVNLDALRGCEGAAAGLYFSVYGSFFPPECPFQCRSRRPPRNPPNAVLSFAYTLLAAEAEAQLHAVNLEPGLGFLHEPEVNRASLALDLIEPLRAPLADALALDLISHRVLQPAEHFDRKEDGCYLNAAGRTRFFSSYEQRMEREFTSRITGQRSTLRQEIGRMALNAALSIEDGRAFEPFLMN